MVVRAADSLWGRTTAPLPRHKSAAGIERWTAGDVVTGDITLYGLGVWKAEVGWGLLHPGHLAVPLLTGPLLCVTSKALWAAVHMVLTAHSLGERAAAPGPRRQAAAGIAIWAAHLQVTLHLLHCVCKHLGEEVCRVLLGEAPTLDQVTHSVLGAAVQVVRAADGIGHWAAAILPTGQLTAGRTVRALGLCIRAHDSGGQGHCPISLPCRGLPRQRVGARGREAAGLCQVTGGTMGAAVHLVLAARSLGHGATAPGAIKRSAARGRAGAFKLAIRALDGTQGAGI